MKKIYKGKTENEVMMMLEDGRTLFPVYKHSDKSPIVDGGFKVVSVKKISQRKYAKLENMSLKDMDFSKFDHIIKIEVEA